MSSKAVHLVQQFVFKGKKLVAGPAREFRSANEAVDRASRDAARCAGVIALTQMVDTDTGEVLEEPAILAKHGSLPAEFVQPF